MSLSTRPPTSPSDRRSLPAPGTFHLLADGSLTWTPDVFRLHGFEPGEVVPSADLMLAHCHRDDRPALAAVLRGAPCAADTGRSVRYRLLDATGGEHAVLAVLTAPAPTVPGDGPAAGTTGVLGVLVDLGAEIGATAARRADDMLSAAIASREVIDQAKGAAMLAYGLDGDAAFDLLRWHSEHLNVKVRTLAERLLVALPGRPDGSDPRELLDAALASLAGGSVDPATAATGPGTPGVGAAAVPRPARLVVHHVPEGRTVHVRLVGTVDGATAPDLVAGLAEALRAVPARGRLVLDASALHRIGPVAALHLTRLRRRAEHAGVQVQVVTPDGATPGR
jgi:anti-anti-sigma regulatory factor